MKYLCCFLLILVGCTVSQNPYLPAQAGSYIVYTMDYDFKHDMWNCYDQDGSCHGYYNLEHWKETHPGYEVIKVEHIANSSLFKTDRLFVKLNAEQK